MNDTSEEERLRTMATLTAEWLEATGTGGYAATTTSGANSRRYHGLLVCGSGPDDSRQVLLSRCDEVVRCKAGSFELGTRLFAEVVAPAGYNLLEEFSRGAFPEYRFVAGRKHSPISVSKAVLAISGENTVLVRYRVSSDTDGVLELQPFCAMRSYHSLFVERTDQMRVDSRDQCVRVEQVQTGTKVHISISGTACGYQDRSEWHRNIYYPLERRRGYDCFEDLFLPGVLQIPLADCSEFFLVISDTAGKERYGPAEWEAEVARRQSLMAQSRAQSDYRRLFLAADQFIVKDSQQAANIIAGYPWFTCWARDALISLPGLCLVTGRYPEARSILEAWMAELSEGMLPNRLGTAKVEYNSVDATLWLATVIHRYQTFSGDAVFAAGTGYEVLKEIIDWHIRGTRFDIGMDAADCLLQAGTADTQLTWMDVLYEGKPVTSRWGKPVEVNALWYNTVCVALELARKNRDVTAAARFQELADAIGQSFRSTFWSDEAGYLYDWVRDDDRSLELRPNQVLALSLPFPLLEKPQANQILEVIKEHLLTPVGLRTLAPTDPNYQGHYEGDLQQRDMAYHQGTVWPWLLAPYVRALLRYRGERGREEARSRLTRLWPLVQEHGFGSIAEVYDGDPPHAPGGCFAQAWSVAAILEIAHSLEQV